MKQGGNSFPSTHNSKKGIPERHKCGVCGRVYKQDYTKNKHERACEIHKKAQSGIIVKGKTL